MERKRMEKRRAAAPYAATDERKGHGFRSVPTLVLYRDGKPTAFCVGILSEQQLGAFFDQLLPRVRRLA